MASPTTNPTPYAPDLSNWLLCFAIGDADCFCSEFVEDHHPVVAEALKFERYQEHPVWGPNGVYGNSRGSRDSVWPGQYTDDTQMTIAVAEAFLAGRAHSAPELADAFVRTFRRDRRQGYSAGLQGVIGEVADGQELLTRLHGRNDSEKNGAAMRSLVYGFASTFAEVAQLAILGARITHDTAAGVSSAHAIAIMSHFAIWEPERPFAQYGEALVRARPDGYHGDWNTLPREGRVVGASFKPADTESLGWRTVRAVLHVLRAIEESWCVNNDTSGPRPEQGRPESPSPEEDQGIRAQLGAGSQALRARPEGARDPSRRLGENQLRDAMKIVLEMGGDTDTVGALVCGILGLRGASPEGWMVDGLENPSMNPSYDPAWGSRFGARYLQNLGARLAARVRKVEITYGSASRSY